MNISKGRLFCLEKTVASFHCNRALHITFLSPFWHYRHDNDGLQNDENLRVQQQAVKVDIPRNSLKATVPFSNSPEKLNRTPVLLCQDRRRKRKFSYQISQKSPGSRLEVILNGYSRPLLSSSFTFGGLCTQSTKLQKEILQKFQNKWIYEKGLKYGNLWFSNCSSETAELSFALCGPRTVSLVAVISDLLSPSSQGGVVHMDTLFFNPALEVLEEWCWWFGNAREKP